MALVISHNQQNVYVINHDDSNIESLLIGTDGKLYPQKVTSLDGIFPTGIAMSADDAYLYVTFTYRKTTATANSGPGGVEVYKMTPRTDGSGGIDIGAPVSSGGVPYFPVGVSPVQVAVGPNITNDGNRTVNPQAASRRRPLAPASSTSSTRIRPRSPTCWFSAATSAPARSPLFRESPSARRSPPATSPVSRQVPSPLHRAAFSST